MKEFWYPVFVGKKEGRERGREGGKEEGGRVERRKEGREGGRKGSWSCCHTKLFIRITSSITMFMYSANMNEQDTYVRFCASSWSTKC